MKAIGEEQNQTQTPRRESGVSISASPRTATATTEMNGGLTTVVIMYGRIYYPHRVKHVMRAAVRFEALTTSTQCPISSRGSEHVPVPPVDIYVRAPVTSTDVATRLQIESEPTRA